MGRKLAVASVPVQQRSCSFISWKRSWLLAHDDSKVRRTEWWGYKEHQYSRSNDEWFFGREDRRTGGIWFALEGWGSWRHEFQCVHWLGLCFGHASSFHHLPKKWCQQNGVAWSHAMADCIARQVGIALKPPTRGICPWLMLSVRRTRVQNEIDRTFFQTKSKNK